MSERAESVVLRLAHQCGFDLAGLTPALPLEAEASQYLDWAARGLAGRMSYLTDHRGEMRADPRTLLPSARTVVCVGRLYNQQGSGPVARYARGDDYHDVLRRDLERMVAGMKAAFGDFEHKICIDTAPLLERSYARAAGIGWIGRNTCLINQQIGSYVFLAEILISLPLAQTSAAPAPDRCGTCRRCIDACPTGAIVPGGLRTELDATRCISYLTIELKGDIPEEVRAGQGSLAFGCDICQEVCPWNRRAPFVEWPGTVEAGDLDSLANLSPEQFRERFRKTPVWRTKYQGLLRNVAVALGNSGDPKYWDTLQQLAASEDQVVRRHAEWALARVPEEAAV